ncbi:MAG: IS66 family transposase [Proteobacteria bacterium]|nr:IS66 family transposase [Pseudomonadota bacterium]
MKIDIKNLPTDPDALKALVISQYNTIDNLEFRIHHLDETLKRYLNREYGRSADVPPVNQRSLFNEAEDTIDTIDPFPKVQTNAGIPVVGYTRDRGGRKPIPAEYPRVDRVYDLTEDQKKCSDPTCGCNLTLIGNETSEQLDIIPAKIQVIRHIRNKYVCTKCSGNVRIATAPIQPIPKSMASAGTLAHIAICKFEDALPLNRQEKIFDRLGLDLPRSTMARWMIACGKMVSPLIERLRQEIIASPVVHMDETNVQVLKEEGRKPWDKSYMWVLARGGPPGSRRAIIYNYHSSRSQYVIERLLQGFKGHLQSDEYSAYNIASRMDGVTRLGCWAHVRRKFVDVLKATPKGNEGSVASKIVGMIKQLYEIEKSIKDLDAESKAQNRKQNAVPILIEIKEFADNRAAQIPPKSGTGLALAYLINAWDHLITYVDFGLADIDNNFVERAIRPFTLGRKNWMFADTPSGAHASAALYSLVETAKANGLDPHQYLNFVFTHLPNTPTDADLEKFLPWNWHPENSTTN